MSNYTPGPWEVGGSHTGDLQIWPSVVFDDNTMPITIAVLPLDKYDRLKDWPEDDGPSKMMEANARLIVSAPEMAELLDDVLVELGIVSSALPSNQRGHIDALHDRVNALLTRIEGREREGE